LRGVDELDFAVVRDTLGISDAALSKHLKVLATEGFLESKKVASVARTDSRRITWLRLTDWGRRAFDAHVRALRDIAAGSDVWPADDVGESQSSRK
jgi:DNA-binding MarR family transcriptional regulator